MLKLTSIINENKEGNIPIKGIELKIIRHLENKFHEFETDEIYNQSYSEDLYEIFSELVDVLKIPYESALKVYTLYINNINEIRSGDDSWKENPNRQYDTSEISDQQLALSQHLQVPFSIINRDNTDYYGLEYFLDEVSGNFYAVGDREEVDRAVENSVENLCFLLNNNSPLKEIYESELGYNYGNRFISEFLYIPEGWKKEIAQEDSRYMVNDFGSGEDLVGELYLDEPESIELKDRYESLDEKRISLSEKIESTDNTEEIERYEEGIERINNELEDLYVEIEEYLLEREYKHSYDRMTYDLQEWLEDYGYLNSYNGELSVRQDQYGKEKTFYPKFLSVDMEKLKKELYEEIRQQTGSHFATYDGIESEEVVDGETYYIYKVV